MILFFTEIDKVGQYRDHAWWFSNMEFAFNVLSSLSLKGRQILKAELIDNDHHLPLPLEAFDGQTFSTPLQQLESEWQHLLGKSVPITPTESLTAVR
jgi:hypothetical protein